MSSISMSITVSTVIIGFLFAGFWWSLNREVGEFEAPQRHFNLGYLLLLLSISGIGYFHLIKPLRLASLEDATLAPPYRAVTYGLVVVLGYMLTQFAHYQVFKWPTNTTWLEWGFFGGTLVAVAVLAAII